MTTSYNDHPQSATIEVASADSHQTKRRIPCIFNQVENRRLRVHALEALPVSMPVSVEYNDALFLGETIVCTKEANEEWTVEIRVEQILTDLQRLLVLRAHLLGEPVPQETFQVAASARN